MSGSVSESGSRLINLRHITQSKAKPTRIAWPGGTIGSNKDEAIARFLEKKRAQGGSLTLEQLELLKRFHSSETAAQAERIAAGEEKQQSDPVAGHKRRRDVHVAVKDLGISPATHKKHAGSPISSKRKGALISIDSAKVAVVPITSARKVTSAASTVVSGGAPRPTISVDDKLSMSLDQLAALRKQTEHVRTTPPAAVTSHKKRK